MALGVLVVVILVILCILLYALFVYADHFEWSSIWGCTTSQPLPPSLSIPPVSMRDHYGNRMFGSRDWGGPNKDGPSRCMPETCVWSGGVLLCSDITEREHDMDVGTAGSVSVPILQVPNEKHP